MGLGGLFENIKARGVKEVGLAITDGNQAMISALSSKFPGIPRQRCIKHKMENVLGYVPKKQREAVGEELKAIFYQENKEKAEQVALAFCEKYRREYPSAVECLWRDYEACLTFYNFPPQHWKAIRTTNAIERLTRNPYEGKGETTLTQNGCCLQKRGELPTDVLRGH